MCEYRGLRHRRPPQVVLPGVRHRRAPRPRWVLLGATFGRRRPEYYRGADGQGTGPREMTPTGHDDSHAGQLNFYKLGFEGTRRWRR